MRFGEYNRMVQRSPEMQEATDTSCARKILINYKEKVFTVEVVKHWNWGPGRLGHLGPQRRPRQDRPRPWTTWPSFEVGPALSGDLGCRAPRGPIRPQLLCDSRKLDPNCWMKPDPALHFRKEPNFRKELQKGLQGGGQNKSNYPRVPQQWQNTHGKQLSLQFPIDLPFRKGRGGRSCVAQRCWLTLRLILLRDVFQKSPFAGTLTIPRNPAVLKEDEYTTHSKHSPRGQQNSRM